MIFQKIADQARNDNTGQARSDNTGQARMTKQKEAIR